MVLFSGKGDRIINGQQNILLLEAQVLGSTLNGVAGFAVCLGLTWGLLAYGELPADIATAGFVQVLTNTQYIWAAKIWFLINNILLDVQLELSTMQLLVLALIPWFVCGIVVGMISRGASKGFGVGFLAMIVSVVISWLIMLLSTPLGIALPGDGIITFYSSNLIQYFLSLLSFQALGFGVVSGAGGLVGGFLTAKRA
jgi:hypothetical protein